MWYLLGIMYAYDSVHIGKTQDGGCDGLIKIIAVGKMKDKALLMQMEMYTKRLRPFTKLGVIEVDDEANAKCNHMADNEQLKEKEGARVLSQIRDSEYVILLDLWGEMLSSEQFADTIEKLQTYQGSTITFVIAGSLGPGKNICQRSNYRWKLSPLTFTHQMTRVLVMEQIYRAFMIQHHNPYHK